MNSFCDLIERRLEINKTRPARCLRQKRRNAGGIESFHVEFFTLFEREGKDRSKGGDGMRTKTRGKTQYLGRQTIFIPNFQTTLPLPIPSSLFSSLTSITSGHISIGNRNPVMDTRKWLIKLDKKKKIIIIYSFKKLNVLYEIEWRTFALIVIIIKIIINNKNNK